MAMGRWYFEKVVTGNESIGLRTESADVFQLSKVPKARPGPKASKANYHYPHGKQTPLGSAQHR
jgi:hypothetical protein